MFEFDPNKSKANKLKHGIDPKQVEIPAKWVDEPRFLIIAQLDQVARRLGVTRQSVIKVFISEKLKEEEL